MRLAKNKDKLTEKEISNVANSTTNGKLSLRAANALLPKQNRRGSTATDDDAADDDESELDIVTQYIKEVLAADEVIAIAWEARDADHVKEIVTAGLKKLADDTEWVNEIAADLVKGLKAEGPTSTTTPSSTGGFERRV